MDTVAVPAPGFRSGTNAAWTRVVLAAFLLLVTPLAPAASPATSPLSPTALAASPDGRHLYVACATSPAILEIETTAPGQRPPRRIGLSAPASGFAFSRDGHRLYVTCPGPRSRVVVLDPVSGRTVDHFATGHTAMSPVLTPDGSTLFVCNRFDDSVVAFDPRSGKELARIRVQREPVAAAITPDGRHLLVANFLHAGRADAGGVAAVVSVIDVATRRVVKELPLPNGTGSLNDLRISPDGRYAVITHIVARYGLPTTQVDRGWMNTNAGTLVDLETLTILNTVLFDEIDRGAASPWGVAWSADGRYLVVAHAGTHEVSLVDFPALVDRLTRLPVSPSSNPGTAPMATPGDTHYAISARTRAEVPDDLAFLLGLRRRIAFPSDARGPRAVAIVGGRAYVANYFSDSLSTFDLAAPEPIVKVLPLGPRPESPTLVRRGEELFHDAALSFQGWQSCATCHPGDARVDALNWDLMNDGVGNPKNNKSLLYVHRTPPAMSLGVRESAETAVRAGIRHILFTVQPESVALALDAYLKSLEPVPSPRLERGRLSAAARRGKRIFDSDRAACAACHPPGLFTDLQTHDVGTRNATDRPEDRFDTPTLVEIWRTAPYLHDGSAATLRDLFGERNRAGLHGETHHLQPHDLDDLIAYLLSL